MGSDRAEAAQLHLTDAVELLLAATAGKPGETLSIELREAREFAESVLVDHGVITAPRRSVGEDMHDHVEEGHDEPSGAKSARSRTIGYFEPLPLHLTVEREPDSGIAWMACCKQLSLCAIGDTPSEAGENLLNAIADRGIAGRGYITEERDAR